MQYVIFAAPRDRAGDGNKFTAITATAVENRFYTLPQRTYHTFIRNNVWCIGAHTRYRSTANDALAFGARRVNDSSLYVLRTNSVNDVFGFPRFFCVYGACELHRFLGGEFSGRISYM